MGQRGPKALPANVHMLRGNPSKKSFADLTGIPQPEIEIPGCPKYLLPEARKEWRRISPELVKLGLISRLDRTALGMYCQAVAHLVWHEQMLQRAKEQYAARQARHEAEQAELVAKATAAGETYVPVEWTGGDGFMLPTPNGSLMYNPHWVARNKLVTEVDKLLASFGMSPSSRGRVSPSSNQMPLFTEGEGEKKGFGAF